MLPVGTTNEDSQGGVSRPTRLSPRLKVRVQELKRLALPLVSRGYAGCRQLLQGAHHTAGSQVSCRVIILSPSTASTPSRSEEFFRVVLAQSFGCLFEQQRSELHGFDIHTSMFTDPGRELLEALKRSHSDGKSRRSVHCGSVRRPPPAGTSKR